MKILNSLKLNLSKKIEDPIQKENFEKILDKNLNKIIKEINKNNRIVLYGDVQSGKTNNMIYLSGWFFEQNYSWIIVLTGDRNSLNDQTFSRFKKAYNNNDYNIYCYINEEIDIFINRRKYKQIIFLKKQTNDLKRIVKKAKELNKKIVVFDDECDYWSKDNLIDYGLNTLFDYEGSKYIGVSATPFWNIFSKYAQKYINIQGVCVLEYGQKYLGFHNFDNYNQIQIKEFFSKKEIEDLGIQLPIKECNKIISVLIKWLLDNKKDNEFLINVKTEQKFHKQIKKLIVLFFVKYIDDNTPNRKKNKETLNINKNQLLELTKWWHLRKSNILIINSNKHDKHNSFKTIKNEKKILIGGFCFSRGNTFEGLTDIIISKNKNTNYDILMQNARFLGYRKEEPNVYLELELIKKYKEIKIINKELKNVCERNNIDEIINFYNMNKSKYKNLFNDKILKKKEKQENEIIKVTEELLKNKKFGIIKDDLIDKVSSKNTEEFSNIENVINNYSLKNKNKNYEAKFVEQKIIQNKTIWSFRDKEKMIKYKFHKESNEAKRRIELGEKVEYLSSYRKGHTKTANDLKQLHKKCAICGLSNKKFLRASHIKQYSVCNKYEMRDWDNFLILCGSCDLIFEYGYVSFNKNGYLDCIEKIYNFKNQSYSYLFKNEKLKKIKLPETYYNKPINPNRVFRYLLKHRKIENPFIDLF